MPLFTEITIALVVAVIFGFVAYLLKQPPIIGFILSGIAVGYLASPGVGGVEVIEGLAPIGVALLLFLVGLEMNFKDIKNVGLPALLTGLGQIIFTFGVGYFIAGWLGFSAIASVYISIALTFSSTIIVVKLLSEKKDINSLYGRIVIGFLLIQDFVAILALIFLAGLQNEATLGQDFLWAIVKGGALVALTFSLSRFIPRILDKIGRSQEMLYLFSIAWALGISALTASHFIGLSIEVGGFIAGIALASSAEHYQIGSRLRPVRDFFLILFFLGLGAKLLAGGVVVPILPAITLSLFVLIGNPLVVMTVMGLLGYRAKTSFLASLTVAQISEFSLIIAASGLRLGHLGPEESSLITLVGIITIFASSYLIIYGDGIYEALKPLLKKFEFRKKLVEETKLEKEMKDHVILVGAHRTGYNILKSLDKSKNDFVALDFDPILVGKLKDRGHPVVYGDVTDEEIRELVGFDRAKAIISTVPNIRDNKIILEAIKNSNKKAKIILTADNEIDAREFYKGGAHYVIVPHFVSGWELAQALGDKKDFSSLIKLQERDSKILDLGF
ncbi:MAG: sodium:proton exchanger [Candidatus Colwellbacteria bacterium CG10_big_fil_rev_8_21_14_0_10_41_28]|uniref:Sodium:proton exchanger n=1 Tax=Candidatus Colwellbacteria bacterium CG10_big_fil_rev_8_21_14_0_10_41_28 TaxID=1974539 RepID=A0A2H0VH14_9BACT|nr:MAG: sodium:proton exchanger [Candidatus Colwellbacteria bacterium CG10_big_fil_rev_8_21_14_0_10_41_28]